MYRLRVWVKMRDLGLKGNTGKVSRLSKYAEEEMEDLGSKILTEVIIYGIIGCSILIAVNLSKKEIFDNDTEEEEMEDLGSKIEKLAFLVDQQQEALDKLDASVDMLRETTKGDV